MMSASSDPQWQCVLVCWGEKYDVQIINRLAQSIAKNSLLPPRFVLITDREHPGLLDSINTVQFPDYWLQAPLRRSGCQAKLVMFDEGILPTDLPAVYIDLDTIVTGDVSRLLRLFDGPRTVAILPSAIIPFGFIGRWLSRVTQGRRYARGNSSVVVFHPAHCHFIAREFKRLFAQHPAFEFRPMVADERFISWVAQPHMRAVPKRDVAKFPGEYMFYWTAWLYIKALLPWVRHRRARQLAVTLNGLVVKPDMLLALQEGEIVVDEKNRKLVWSQRTLGPMKQTVLNYYAGIRN